MSLRAWPLLACLALVACNAEPSGSGASASAATPPSAQPSTVAAASAAAAAQAAPAGNVPDAIDGANATMGDADVDGLKSKRLSCKCSGGAFGSMAVLGALSKQKDALAKCGAGEPRIYFSFQAGKTSDVRVSGFDEAKARCVAALVEATVFPDEGVCALTLVLGGDG
jgi:hypothetical protein